MAKQNRNLKRLRFMTTRQMASDIRYEARQHHVKPYELINHALAYYFSALHHDFSNMPSILVQRQNELSQEIHYYHDSDMQILRSILDFMNRYDNFSSGRINDYLHHDR